jgi:DNA primase
MTEEHVQLLWRMSDAPVLCFDGDSAGQRAAERAAGIVLPLLAPGKTVKIATLPEGQDPDDLIKEHGREAFADVLERAVTLSDMVWTMETGGVLPDTPEARAALEARLRERAGAIGDASVRRHYMQAFDEKLAAFFTPVRQARFSRGDRRGAPGRRSSPRLVVSDTLRNSRLMKPGRGTAVSPREATILMSLVNHPQLAETRLEQLGTIDFETPAARSMLSAILDLVTRDHDIARDSLIAGLGLRGFGEAIEQMRALLARQGIWQAGAEIAESDAETGLQHALALHEKRVKLAHELRSVERELGVDPTETAFERLKEIQEQINSVDGTEALIEGFGALSGRATRSF